MSVQELALEDEFTFLRTATKPYRSMSPALPKTNVIAEVKPHTATGIATGLAQLRGRLQKRMQTRQKPPTLTLVTYRRAPNTDRQLEVLVADPKEVADIVRSRARGATPATWYVLGVVPVNLRAQIPAASCPSYIGVQAEPHIRALYGRTVGVSLPEKSVFAPGADIEHEFGFLLRELEATDATVYDRIVEQLGRELTLRFPGPSDPRLLQRRHRLRALFASVPESRAQALYTRLGDRRTRDPLSALFHGRLARITRQELLRILRGRFPKASAAPVPHPLTMPQLPLPADATERFRKALTALRAQVLAAAWKEPRARRLLCILDKLESGADDRVITWARICPGTSGAIGAAWVIGNCDITQGSPVDQAALQSAVRTAADVEPANARLRFITHLRSDILLSHEIASPGLQLTNFINTHDQVQLALRNLDQWANNQVGGSSAMPQAYRTLAGWIQRKRDDTRTAFSCF